MKTILFDFFGVFSTPVYKKIIEKFLLEQDHAEWMRKLDVLDAGELSEEELVSLIAKKSGTSEDVIWEEVDNAPKVNQELFDFVEDNLAGKYRIGLLTNIARGLIERIIPEKLSLFDPLIISSDVGLVKPDPEIFAVAIERCGCSPEEILLIDDGEKNVTAAKASGLNGLVYRDFATFTEELKTVLGI